MRADNREAWSDRLWGSIARGAASFARAGGVIERRERLGSEGAEELRASVRRAREASVVPLHERRAGHELEARQRAREIVRRVRSSDRRERGGTDDRPVVADALEAPV